MICFCVRMWSYFPILAITNDNNFGTNNDGKIKNMRFSFINLMLGNFRLYIFTFIRKDVSFVGEFKNVTVQHIGVRNEGVNTFNIDIKSFKRKTEFKFFYKIKIDRSDNDKDLNAMATKYKKHVKNLNESDRSIEKEYLLYLKNKEQHRIDVSFEKMNFYILVVLALIPLSKIILINEDPNKIFYIVGVIYLYYGLLNSLILVVSFLKVRGSMSAKFLDLKESNDKSEQLMYSYYLDWKATASRADEYVTYILNTEKAIKTCIVFFIILLLI